MTASQFSGEALTTPSEWIYRGEGNCNIVISLPKTKQILRIRKIEKPKSIFGWILVLISDFLYWYSGKGFKNEIRDLNFYSKIMRPLLGNTYTSESKQVILSRKQMQIFRDGVTQKRPEYRQNKTMQYGRAAIFNDFAFLPNEFDNLQLSGNTFAVEIKPKQGWRPVEEQNYSECLFCMHQYLKLEKKTIKTRTKYCPEELFSGDKCRMKAAIKNLFEVPQNNLKIFKNGILYGEKYKNLEILREIFESDDSEELLSEEFCDFLQRCLVTNLIDRNDEVSSFCKNGCRSTLDNTIDLNNINTKLPKGSVLEKILSIQMLDTEGTQSTYKKLKKSDHYEDYSFVEKALELLERKQESCVRCLVKSAPKSCRNELIFFPYLVSAIAKDCSLMISFRKLSKIPSVEPIKTNIFETKYGAFVVNIGIFDLYPKPLSTIQKHYKRNKDIFKALKKRELGNK